MYVTEIASGNSLSSVAHTDVPGWNASIVLRAHVNADLI
jgi:hypothetical protein